MTDMTVLEFATKHCATEHAVDAEQIQAHVDVLAKCAVYQGKRLWRVVLDGEGRSSLIWITMDERLWAALLDDALKVIVFEYTLRGLL